MFCCRMTPSCATRCPIITAKHLIGRFTGGLIKTNIATSRALICAIAGVFPWAQLLPACRPSSGPPSALITPARQQWPAGFLLSAQFPVNPARPRPGHHGPNLPPSGPRSALRRAAAARNGPRSAPSDPPAMAQLMHCRAPSWWINCPSIAPS